MKRIAAAVLLAVALCLSTALAAESSWQLEDIDARFALPEGDFYVLYPGMDPEDQALADLGLTSEEIDQIMAEGNMRLDMVCFDGSYELTVHVLTGADFETIFNYALLSKSQRNVLMKEATKEMEKQGMEAEKCDWYETNGLLFFVTKTGMPDSEGWCYQYQTVFNGKCVSVTARSAYTDAPTEEMLAQVKAMADSLSFGHEDSPPEPEEVESAPNHIVRNIMIGGVVGAVAGGVWQWIDKRKKR